MTSTLRGWREWGWGWQGKNEMLSDLDGGGSKCTGRPIFSFFLLKKIGFAPWPETMLGQASTFYWQEIFLMSLTSDSEAIL